MKTNLTSETLLKKHRIRPTQARIAMLEGLKTVDPESLNAEEMYTLLFEQGHAVSMGTIYRVFNQLEHVGVLVREWDDQHRGRYRMATSGQPAYFRLICRQTGRTIHIEDEKLRQLFVGAAAAKGVALGEQTLDVYADCTA